MAAHNVLEPTESHSVPVYPAIVDAAASLFGVHSADIMSPRRAARLCRARFAAMLVMHRRGYSLQRIATGTGRKDHTTAVHGLRQAEALFATDRDFARVISTIERRTAA